MELVTNIIFEIVITFENIDKSKNGKSNSALCLGELAQ